MNTLIDQTKQILQKLNLLNKKFPINSSILIVSLFFSFVIPNIVKLVVIALVLGQKPIKNWIDKKGYTFKKKHLRIIKLSLLVFALLVMSVDLRFMWLRISLSLLRR